MKIMKQLQPTQLDRYDRQKIGPSSPKMRHNQLGRSHQSSSDYLKGLIMHGANFYQNAALRGHMLVEQIEFFIAELDLVIRYFQIHHLDFILRFTGDRESQHI
ncbi:MAG: hypothetical protein DI542_06065 [Acinetobacter johnsonii]|uniref:Uncharacterized protein n=1 Tax=Acinetobacter johnsonii TaxID=40214 RepID=A0A2W5RVN6_ACIJO|nr:MAG: hypothetical protein DI631_09385 [Acinetobacter johnsonii]PZQ92174.1 MAG: hypothetical protein DI542_06065 [Acinetobacter johnsonii]